VLVVEDNPDSRESLRFLLERWGHRVDVAATGPDGLRLATMKPPDVAIIDLGLPLVDGFGVARGLRAAAGSHITLIACTAWDDSESRMQADAAGFDAYLVKPRDLLELLRWFDPRQKPRA
jgi:DNA-binding response OmpR family regulator